MAVKTDRSKKPSARAQLAEYRRKKNERSIDGLPAFNPPA